MALVQIFLRVTPAADRTVRRVIPSAPISPYRRKWELVVLVRAARHQDQVALRHDGDVHLHLEALRNFYFIGGNSGFMRIVALVVLLAVIFLATQGLNRAGLEIPALNELDALALVLREQGVRNIGPLANGLAGGIEMLELRSQEPQVLVLLRTEYLRTD